MESLVTVMWQFTQVIVLFAVCMWALLTIWALFGIVHWLVTPDKPASKIKNRLQEPVVPFKDDWHTTVQDCCKPPEKDLMQEYEDSVKKAEIDELLKKADKPVWKPESNNVRPLYYSDLLPQAVDSHRNDLVSAINTNSFNKARGDFVSVTTTETETPVKSTESDSDTKDD